MKRGSWVSLKWAGVLIVLSLGGPEGASAKTILGTSQRKGPSSLADRSPQSLGSKIEAYESAEKQLHSEQAKAQRLSEELKRRGCSPETATTSKCRKLYFSLSDSRKSAVAIQKALAKLAPALGSHLRVRDEKVREEKAWIESLVTTRKTPPSESDLVALIEGLQKSEFLTEEARFQYAVSLNALRLLNPALMLQLLRKTPGYKDRICGDDAGDQECWDFHLGLISYRTRAGIRIDSSCFLSRGLGVDFPTHPAAYVSALDRVADQLESCLSSINVDGYREINVMLAQSKPFTLFCDPRAADDEIECAHADRGVREVALTRPHLCGGLSKTLFHELLHLAGNMENMVPARHNDPLCRRFDAVYACSDICFPEKDLIGGRAHHRVGCEACVTQGRARPQYCRGLPSALDTAYGMCSPRTGD